jgi:hypothetical protein
MLFQLRTVEKNSHQQHNFKIRHNNRPQQSGNNSEDRHSQEQERGIVFPRKINFFEEVHSQLG